jgi:hypothetical protein
LLNFIITVAFSGLLTFLAFLVSVVIYRRADRDKVIETKSSIDSNELIIQYYENMLSENAEWGDTQIIWLESFDKAVIELYTDEVKKKEFNLKNRVLKKEENVTFATF